MATEGRLEGAPLEDAPARQDREGARGRAGAPAAVRDLEEELRGQPYSFAFFQMVRLLEDLRPQRRSVGGFFDPEDEVARFRVEPFISFPASEVQRLELNAEDAPAHVWVNFLGLTGPLGVLPYYYTLLVAERQRGGDYALRDFLDIFHHRFISLFYRAWERNRLIAAYEKDGRDPVTSHLLDLVGLGLPSDQNQLPVRDEMFLFYSGLVAPHQRSAVALEQMLEDYFGVSVEVEQFVGGWYPLATGTQCGLGEETSSERLGLGAVVGDEIWDQQSRVRLRIGPLTREQYERFLPTGSAFETLRTLTRFFSDEHFEFEVQLVLARDEVPGCVIGAEDEEAMPLGWSTWMRTAPFDRDADEAILAL